MPSTAPGLFLEQLIPHVTVTDWKTASLSKHRELLDYFGKKIPMSSFSGFSEKPIFLKKNLKYGRRV